MNTIKYTTNAMAVVNGECCLLMEKSDRKNFSIASFLHTSPSVHGLKTGAKQFICRIELI